MTVASILQRVFRSDRVATLGGGGTPIRIPEGRNRGMNGSIAIPPGGHLDARPHESHSKPAMNCHQISPMTDGRWEQFVAAHPQASVFHTTGWLGALRKTYGYEPVAFTTSAPSEDLRNAVVFCQVKSWLTGRRLVSLPFSDHCEPLSDSIENTEFLFRHLQSAVNHQDWRYLEIRPTDSICASDCERFRFLPAARFVLHTMDLRPDVEAVFRSLDKDSVRRRVHRADRAGLTEGCGRSDDLLRDFYKLFVLTRRRLQIPPSPIAWFRNLVNCLGDALEIRVAYHQNTPAAAVLILHFRETAYYKYGCSDVRFKHLGATPWILWKAIAGAKSRGAKRFDLGRTEEGNAGLRAFKRHWAPEFHPLIYWKYPVASSMDSLSGRSLQISKRVFSLLPNRLLTFTGWLFYRHIG